MARKLPADRVLSALGYEPLHNRVYKATWSSPDVEHFLFLDANPRRISTALGIRNLVAEVFSRRSIVKYGGDSFAGITWDERSSCTMQFYFPYSDPFWNHSIRGLFDPNLGLTLERSLTQFVLPAIKGVTTSEQLLALLLTNSPPCHWPVVNGAIRAAQIIALAGTCGKSADQTLATLAPYERFVAQGFPKNSPSRHAPREYITAVLKDWDSFIASSHWDDKADHRRGDHP